MARHGHRQAAVGADALRCGQLLQVMAVRTRAPTEARLARLEATPESLNKELAELDAMRRALDSLCRIAEFEALSAIWLAGEAEDETDRDPEERPR